MRDKLKAKPGIAPLLANPNDKSSVKFDDEEKASILLKQFSSVFNMEHEGEIPRIPRRTEQSVGELRVTEVMVKKELLSLNINKSSGPDKIYKKITNLRFYHLERNQNMLMQYGRRDSVEISGIPQEIGVDKLEDEVIDILKEAEVRVNRQFVKKWIFKLFTALKTRISR